MTANLDDYDLMRREFSWTAARSLLTGLPGGRGLNIADEAVDRHPTGSRRDAAALRCVGPPNGPVALTYAQLSPEANRFANLLGEHGLRRGDLARCTFTVRCSPHHVTARFALDLRPGDAFWCTADPGWVTQQSPRA